VTTCHRTAAVAGTHPHAGRLLPPSDITCSGNATRPLSSMSAVMLLNDEPGGKFYPLSFISKLVRACSCGGA